MTKIDPITRELFLTTCRILKKIAQGHLDASVSRDCSYSWMQCIEDVKSIEKKLGVDE